MHSRLFKVAENTIVKKNYTFKSQDKLIRIESPQVWGVLNLTRDSFYSGSRRPGLEEAFAEAEKHLKAGIKVLDIGAMSSRPGAAISKVQEELDQLLPLIERIKSSYENCLISIDTIHAEVAEECVSYGADIINDISGGLYDPDMLRVVGKLQVPIVLMHMRGTPATMQDDTSYDNLIGEIMLYFKERIEACKAHGIRDIILDPGFGFSKTRMQNMQLIGHIPTFKIYDCPILIGVSRKSTIYKTLGITPEEALNGTTALHVIALNKGADIIRVHDSREALEVVKLLLFYQATMLEEN